ncbi:ribosomal protein S18-alanine N-acetyltransferase [Streptococcus sp. DD13]|uniref:ribosomal protein S18-alanine N-acetyltransferase n=1 Tax=Streptococcus sp. DD13 TaxID=1777881 RepID=UPI001E47FABD|nr:ribosomal protein S18-alanine N-acetyltransferase [Streptococcus sp. DD13]
MREINGLEEEQVSSIEELLRLVYGASSWTRQQIQSNLSLESSRYLGAWREGKLVALLVLHLMGQEQEILQLVVDPDCRRQGLARLLLEQLEQYGPQTFLEVRRSNHAARTLYQKIGFKEIGIRKNYYHAPIEDAFVLRREIER